jgi:gamma-glutamyltranspeptidase/glutathione hydrolase
MQAMVSSGNALASMAGLRVMLDGGSAIDATIATNAMLQVVTPMTCGLGGDLFALVYETRTGKVHGFNGSGRAPAALTIDEVRGRGHEAIPLRSALSITVPGCVDAWSQLHERFGRLPWARLFEPAIAYAREGHPTSRAFAASVRNRERRPRSWLAAFASAEELPAVGDISRQPELADSLQRVAMEGRDAVYGGELGRKIAAEVQAEGGVMTEADIAAHSGEWNDPVTSTYRGRKILQTAPNSQGLTALIALNLLEQVDLPTLGFGTPETLRYQIEATKLAYHDRDNYLTDPRFAKIDVDWLLSKQRRAGELERAVHTPLANVRRGGDTTSFCVVDPDGNAVSCIQSNYSAYGSSLVAGGFALQNRGAYFSLDPQSINRLEPGKRTMHTLMSAMVLADEKPWVLFNCVGADVQPQVHIQVLTNLLDFGMNVQEAIEAPRYIMGRAVSEDPPSPLEPLRLEGRLEAAVEGLQALGYAPERSPDIAGRPGFGAGFGFGHGIVIDPKTGVRYGGADPRWDSYAIGY